MFNITTGEMEIKTTMEKVKKQKKKYHLTLVRMAIIFFKKSTDNNMLERMWRKGNPLTLLLRV